MIAPKFIRFQKNILKVDDIQQVVLDQHGDTTITYTTEGHNHWFTGDVRDKIWELIKLALQPKDVGQPDTTDVERRVEGIEERIGPRFTEKNRDVNTSLPDGYTVIQGVVYKKVSIVEVG